MTLPHTWNAFDGRTVAVIITGAPVFTRFTCRILRRVSGSTWNFRVPIILPPFFCNGKKLGCHKGGFSTFRFELTDAMQPFGNELTADAGEMENYYTVNTPGAEVLKNDECLRIVSGWLMANQAMPLPEKMTLISCLSNYGAMWGERTIAEIPAVKRLISKEDLDLLDRMLRRVKEPE